MSCLSSLLRLKLQQKDYLKSPGKIHFDFAYSTFLFIWNWNDRTRIHNRNSYVNQTRFHGSKWSITVLRPKRRKNPTLWGGTYLYGFYKGVPPGLTALGNRCNVHQIYFARDDWAYYLGTSHHLSSKNIWHKLTSDDSHFSFSNQWLLSFCLRLSS